MSLASLNLNPAIAKLTSNGQIQCIVCSMQNRTKALQTDETAEVASDSEWTVVVPGEDFKARTNKSVKAKIWTAHVNGKKHKDSCEKLKQQLAASVKRPSDESPVQNGAPPEKKIKDTHSPPSAPTASLPSDFFDEEPGLSIQTPWQKAKDDEALIHGRKGIIEGVPHGFFDDKKKDGMVRETIENEAHMNEEYDRLMRELNEKNTEDDAKADEEDEREARLRDIANADEQMEKWMRLNAMEKLKESRLQQAREQAAAQEVDDEGSEDDDTDFSDWRAKRFL